MTDPPLSNDSKLSVPPSAEAEDAGAADANRDPGSSSRVYSPPDDQLTVISNNPPISTTASQQQPANRMQELSRSLEGQQLGDFRLEEFVGGGGMGAVFRATDLKLGRTVAVKVLSRDHSDDEIRRRFQNEAQSAARLDHENIARVYYVGEHEGMNYIVFEFIDGVNVRDLVLHKGPLPLEEALSYIVQVTHALNHAYQRNVVHRDIKPSNILVTQDGRANLVDIGLARLHHLESTADDLTQSGVTLGTFDYISPEQARDPRSADVRSDIYSLGCTLYFMLTGQPPFPEGTVLQKLLSHSSDPPPDPRLFRPDLTEEIAAIVQKMLAKHPDHRQFSPAELANEIMVAAEHIGLQLTVGRTGAVLRQPRTPSVVKQHLWWAIPALALLLLSTALHFASQGEVNVRQQGELNLEPALPIPVTDPPTPASVVTEEPGQTPPEPTEVPAVPPEPANTPPAAEFVADPFAVDPVAQNDVSLSDIAIQPPSFVAELSAAPSGIVAISAASDVGQEYSLEARLADASEPELVPATPRILAVGEPAGNPEEDVQYVASLAEACRLAAENTALEAIELRYNGPRNSPALQVTASRLTIRAGQEYDPIVRFQPNASTATSSSSNIIEVRGGELIWQNVDVHVEVADVARSCALFFLNKAKGIEVRDCWLTIHNRALNADQVAFFEVARPEMRETLNQAGNRSPRTNIDIQRCVMRGQSTLCHLDEMTPFALAWEEGLFLSSGRVLDMRGAVDKPANPSRGIEIDLRDVTAIVDRGICSITLDGGSPNFVETHFFANNCLFQSGDDFADPLYRITGVESEEQVQRQVSVRGVNNLYFASTPFMQIGVEVEFNVIDVVEFSFEQIRDGNAWYDELNSAQGTWILWDPERTEQRARDVALRTPQDYTITDEAVRQRVMDTGCDLLQLPKMPFVEDAAEAESATPAAATGN